MSKIWTNIFRYFPSLQSCLNLSPEDMNREDNVMMMISPFHEEFEHFRFIFEATETPNRYRLKTFPCFASGYAQFLPHDNIVTFSSHDNHYALPNAIHLAVHAAIGNILHATSRGRKIEKLMRDLEDHGSLGLAKDGSTKVSDLLSVSSLSILSSSWS